MRYDQVWPALLALIVADGTISGVVGTDITKSGESDFVVPRLEWTFIVGTPEAEMFYRFQVQLDVFTRNIADLLTVANRLKQLLHQRTEWSVGGYWLTSQFLAERDVPEAGGVNGAQLDFEITVVRGR